MYILVCEQRSLAQRQNYSRSEARPGQGFAEAAVAARENARSRRKQSTVLATFIFLDLLASATMKLHSNLISP